MTDIIEEVKEIMKQRGEEVGKQSLFEEIALRWSMQLGIKISPKKVCLMMAELKLARLAQNIKHRDSLIDLIGYSVLSDSESDEGGLK